MGISAAYGGTSAAWGGTYTAYGGVSVAMGGTYTAYGGASVAMGGASIIPFLTVFGKRYGDSNIRDRCACYCRPIESATASGREVYLRR